MREIKFRGLSENEDGSKKWVYGYYGFCEGEPVISDIDGTGIFVIPETVGQYTGLKDKNGSEIYEGDIIERKEEYPEVVTFKNGDFTLDYSNAYGRPEGTDYCNLGFYVMDRKCCTVIGNIYENPELLKHEG